MKWIAFKQ